MSDQWQKGANYERSSRLDVVDLDYELFVSGELPGVEEDDIEVTILGDRLMIVTERKLAEEEEEDAYYRHDVGCGKLMRIIALPDKVDSELIHSQINDGILEVLLPKLEVAERHTTKVA